MVHFNPMMPCESSLTAKVNPKGKKMLLHDVIITKLCAKDTKINRCSAEYLESSRISTMELSCENS